MEKVKYLVLLFLNDKNTMMKKYLLIIYIAFSFTFCKAQQEILYTQYIFSQLAVNPAYAGNNSDPSIVALSRKQWIGLEGSPTSVSLFADGSVFGSNLIKERNFREDRRFAMFSGNKELGVGLILFNDRVGVNSTFLSKMAYSYKINFSSSTRLSFGLQAGILNFKQSFDKLENIEPNDEIFQNKLDVIRFNMGSGVFFETERYFVSFAVPSIFKNDLDNIDDVTNETLLRQYFFSAGYLFYLHPLYKLKPTIMVRKTEELPMQFDLNIHLLYKNRIWTGLSYRYKNSINISSQIMFFQSLSIGLAYDISIGQVRSINQGSAEILINYVFQHAKKRIINPRYF